MTEGELQQGIIDLASVLRWRVYHTMLSKGSHAGFPDLVLLRPPRLVFAELKDDRGKPTLEQGMWLDELGKIDEEIEAVWDLAEYAPFRISKPRPGVEVYLWRPDEWTSGEIERVLR